ncbi:hypothetical protein E2542_SST27151 [Spatholobus suberectus]|nr:hypothetical protein E2542_SST27151 [Spatholobus suberectus]
MLMIIHTATIIIHHQVAVELCWQKQKQVVYRNIIKPRQGSEVDEDELVDEVLGGDGLGNGHSDIVGNDDGDLVVALCERGWGGAAFIPPHTTLEIDWTLPESHCWTVGDRTGYVSGFRSNLSDRPSKFYNTAPKSSQCAEV